MIEHAPAGVGRAPQSNGEPTFHEFGPPRPPRSGGGGPLRAVERALAARLLEDFGNPPVSLTLDDGTTLSPEEHAAFARLSFRDRSTFWRVLADPVFEFADAYSRGSVALDGDLVEFLRCLNDVLGRRKGERPQSVISRWRHRPRRNTIEGSQENIHRHYDIGNDFYRLWLDEQLVYTCAYFSRPTTSLEEAQTAKLDHVCRKLDLRRGEHVVEAGCGWGALALHMAKHYGVRVRAYNISREQVAYARSRAKAEGLADRVEVVQEDWRNITGRYDAFVSVGMLEHVGLENYRHLGDAIAGCLKPEGRGLIHSIGQNSSRPFDPWTERRIFPGAYPPTLAEMMTIFEPSTFSVLDVENIRLHYAETLKRWLHRFEQRAGEVRSMFDEKFVRMWRLYLAGSMLAFESGRLQLFQVVFAPAENNAVPRTRGYQYRENGEASGGFESWS